MTTSIGARSLIAAAAAFAALAAGLLSIDRAGAASSGGVGPAGTVEEKASGDKGSANKHTAKYDRLWDRVSARDKRWARKTAECESGRDPDAIGSGGRYRGAFQFMRSTWKAAPKSPGGDPIDYSYVTQAVVAVALKRADGAGHWPVCG